MSSDDRTRAAKEIFLDALDRENDERESFLREACRGDTKLRQRVDGLLAAHGSSERVLGEPVTGLASIVDLGPGDEVGPYTLGDVLGEGGFGVVFRAEQRKPVRRRVALKVVKLGMDTKAVIARFEIERQALALMEHANIARVYDAGATESGRPYFVMELVDGVPITDHCAGRRSTVRERLELFRTTCLAVQHAHQKGVVHRDLKPSNVLVGDIDGEAIPKVIDFGIAKAAGGELGEHGTLSREGHLIGTPIYMSPEQIAGSADVDTRTDVYALGILLYELLTGTPPFAGMELLELQRAIRDDDPPRPSSRVAERRIPADLDWIAMRCLEKDPARRYPTAFALAADVGRFLDDLPVEAGQPSTMYRFKKLVHRHRTATVAAVLVLVSVVGGTVGIALGLVEANRANEELGLSIERERHEANRAREAESLAAREAEEARRQERIARAVNEFLNDELLTAASPYRDEERGYDVSLRDVLDAASERIEEAALPGGRFAETPLVEAAIRFTLAYTYSDLDEFESALPHARRCAELRRAELGGDHSDTLEIESLLAGVLRRTGSYDEAEDLLLEVVDRERAALGPTHRLTLLSVGRLVRTWAEQHRYDEAIEYGERALAEATAARGNDDVVVGLMESLATICAQAGNFDRAGELFERVLELRRTIYGNDAVETASALMNVALFHSRRFRPDLAEPLLREALAVHERILGPDHPGTIEAMVGLARTFTGSARLEEARELYERAHERSARRKGADDPDTLRILVDVSSVYGALGRFDKVEELLRTAIDGYAESLPLEDEQYLRARRELAFLLTRVKRFSEAREILESVHETQLAALGPAHPVTLRTLLYRAGLEKDDQHLPEAEAMMREGLDLALDRYGERDPWPATFARSLAEVLNRQSRWSEAEPVALDAVAWSREAYEAESIDLGMCLMELGFARARQGNHAGAEAPFLESFAILRKRFSTGTAHLTVAVELARIYEALGRDDEVARFRAVDPRVAEWLDR